LDSSKWDNVEVAGDNGGTEGVGSWSVSNGYLSSDDSNKPYGVVSKTTFNPPYIVSARMRNNPNGLDDDVIGVLFAYTAPSSYYAALICFGDTGWGSSTALVADSLDAQEKWNDDTKRTTPKNGEWHRMDVVFKEEAKAAYYLDTTLLSDLTCSVKHSTGKVGLVSGYMDHGAHYDFIFVRKYADSEPTITIESEESKE
jgi:hypothetical protein